MGVFTVALFFPRVALLKVTHLIGQLALWDFSHVTQRNRGRHTDCKPTDVSTGVGWGPLFVTEGATGVRGGVAACFLVTGISCEVRA